MPCSRHFSHTEVWFSFFITVNTYKCFWQAFSHPQHGTLTALTLRAVDEIDKGFFQKQTHIQAYPAHTHQHKHAHTHKHTLCWTQQCCTSDANKAAEAHRLHKSGTRGLL